MLVAKGQVLACKEFVNKRGEKRYKVELWGDRYLVAILRHPVKVGDTVEVVVEISDKGTLYEKV